ncbi:MAG TPA: hypothetical protein VLC09_01250 [Polyangiaceae bacterium]|nr:hypothetical protein [Polyangiaceae bacterium]
MSLLVAATGVGGCTASASGGVSGKSADASAKMTTDAHGGSSHRLGQVRLVEDACAGTNLKPSSELLTQRDLRALLDAKGIPYTVTVERSDLHLFDLELHGSKTRLRVATLDSPREAGRHLHKALLEHGSGYWGVHRSNLAVLGPPADIDETIGFSLETGLACWGVLTAADRDDTFVVPGGYFEF